MSTWSSRRPPRKRATSRPFVIAVWSLRGHLALVVALARAAIAARDSI